MLLSIFVFMCLCVSYVAQSRKPPSHVQIGIGPSLGLRVFVFSCLLGLQFLYCVLCLCATCTPVVNGCRAKPRIRVVIGGLEEMHFFPGGNFLHNRQLVNRRPSLLSSKRAPAEMFCCFFSIKANQRKILQRRTQQTSPSCLGTFKTDAKCCFYAGGGGKGQNGTKKWMSYLETLVGLFQQPRLISSFEGSWDCFVFGGLVVLFFFLTKGIKRFSFNRRKQWVSKFRQEKKHPTPDIALWQDGGKVECAGVWIQTGLGSH